MATNAPRLRHCGLQGGVTLYDFLQAWQHLLRSHVRRDLSD